MSNASTSTVRAARPRELKRVRALLAEAIDASPYYGNAFKRHEKSRFSEGYLRALLAADPWHVALAVQGPEIAGFVLTTPEYGTLWSPWVYVAPQHQTRALGILLIRFMIRHWDNGRFHKIACHVRPDNRTARAVFRHFGFAEIALLKQNTFGEDVLLLERPLNKSESGYDDGVRLGRLHLLGLRIGDLFGRSG